MTDYRDRMGKSGRRQTGSSIEGVEVTDPMLELPDGEPVSETDQIGYSVTVSNNTNGDVTASVALRVGSTIGEVLSSVEVTVGANQSRTFGETNNLVQLNDYQTEDLGFGERSDQERVTAELFHSTVVVLGDTSDTVSESLGSVTFTNPLYDPDSGTGNGGSNGGDGLSDPANFNQSDFDILEDTITVTEDEQQPTLSADLQNDHGSSITGLLEFQFVDRDTGQVVDTAAQAVVTIPAMTTQTVTVDYNIQPQFPVYPGTYYVSVGFYLADNTFFATERVSYTVQNTNLIIEEDAPTSGSIPTDNLIDEHQNFDFNDDGVVDAEDVDIFLNDFDNITAEWADLNGDGSIDIFDVGALESDLEAVEAGEQLSYLTLKSDGSNGNGGNGGNGIGDIGQFVRDNPLVVGVAVAGVGLAVARSERNQQ